MFRSEHILVPIVSIYAVIWQEKWSIWHMCCEPSFCQTKEIVFQSCDCVWDGNFFSRLRRFLTLKISILSEVSQDPSSSSEEESSVIALESVLVTHAPFTFTSTVRFRIRISLRSNLISSISFPGGFQTFIFFVSIDWWQLRAHEDLLFEIF